ncbi:hypothetical protein LBMAG21_11780 [Armatimonadota bacterium]|nr:hypothetical protein LBMAG21_11780 [Armatimonadota bacterium]
MQGQDAKDVDLLGLGLREKANFTYKEQALLDYVKVLTLTPSNVKDTDVERLRKVGWNDNEIFEASFITALFAFFNRMADAYGLDYDPSRWLPPTLRPSASAEPKPIK